MSPGSETATSGSIPATRGSNTARVVQIPPGRFKYRPPSPYEWFKYRHPWFNSRHRWFRIRHRWFR
jgi:hypothetical protein